jgi:hypothetical protein
MNVPLERSLFALVIGAFVVASGSSLMASGPISEQEAIEISKRSELVRENLSAPSHRFVAVNTDYYNFSRIERMREWVLEEIPYHAEDSWLFKVPQGHDVWAVSWYMSEGPTVFSVGVIVDAQTERIIDEAGGGGYV